MRDVRRLLWSVILLSLAGCQSISTGSSGLLERINDTLSTSGETLSRSPRMRALLSSRRAHRPVGPTERQSKSSRGNRSAVQQEQASGRDRPKQPASPSPPGNQTEPSAHQRILTADAAQNSPPGPNTPRRVEPDSQSETDWPHPLVEDSGALAAPVPGGARRGRQDSAPTDGEPTPTPPEVAFTKVTPIFDAFGVGGESLAARAGMDQSAAIHPPGSNRTATDDETAAGAIARDLESDKASQSIFWQEDLDKLIALLETQVAQQQPGGTDEEQELYLRQHVALRMLYLIASRRPEALQAIPQLGPEQQQFWTQMFWALSSAFDDEAMPDSRARAAETVAQLREAIRHLQPQARLQLDRTLLCRQINGFGDFVPFDEQEFRAGQPVLIYTEVQNFQSEATAAGDFRTVLRSSIRIQEESEAGRVVFEHDLPETEDRCRSRRNDYFHSYRIQLPRSLQPGPHMLTLEITDTLTGTRGTAQVNFVVR